MYRGEKIDIYLSGDDSYELSEINFSVFIYPDGDINTEHTYSKSDCTLQEDGSYLLTLSSSVTAGFALASYTIEIHDSTSDVIFVQPHAFSIEQSATGISMQGSNS